jgi:predicted ferric reductase
MFRRIGRATGIGNWVMVASSGAGLLLSTFNYVSSDNGIHGSVGALLVIISSALILIVSLLMAFGLLQWRWLRMVVDVLLILGIIGTGFAAYMLEADWLAALTVLCLTGWLIHVFPVPAQSRRHLSDVPTGAAS